MTYATRQDMEARFGTVEVANLATDPGDETVDRLPQALADADAVINGFLAVAYQLPLPSDVTYPLLTHIACDHARAALYDDSPLEAPSERMSRGIRRLEQLRDGRANLVDSDGRILKRRNVVQRAGPDPVFTRDALKGF